MDRQCVWVERGARAGNGDIHVSDASAKFELDATGNIVCNACHAKTGYQINGIRYDVVRGRGGRVRYSASASALLGPAKV